jgi:hypothetical protein
VFLAQRPETVDRLGVPDAVKEKLKSLVSVPGEFSELAIKAPEGFAFGRLVLDPFSLAVFSSKGATVERLRHYASRGDGCGDRAQDHGGAGRGAVMPAGRLDLAIALLGHAVTAAVAIAASLAILGARGAGQGARIVTFDPTGA